MDFTNMANMKLSDFENLGKAQYDKGFTDALGTVIKILSDRICEDFNADGVCEHPICQHNYEFAEGLDTVKRGRML